MANNRSGVDDLNYMVWVDYPVGNVHYVHGLTLDNDRVALCHDFPHAEACAREMQKKYPGATVFINRSTHKIPMQVTPLPTIFINEKGEVLM